MGNVARERLTHLLHKRVHLLAITWTPNITVSENVVAGWEWDGPNRRMRYYENGVLQGPLKSVGRERH